MYALSVGIQNVSQTLPSPVYALLSGLNAATVGIVAVSAVQLAEKAIRDKISRILVIFGACAGLCYNALWYFPVLMLIGGLAIAIWDGWLYSQIQRARIAWKNRNRRPADSEEANTNSMAMESIPPEEVDRNETMIRARRVNPSRTLPQSSEASSNPTQSTETGASQSPKYVIRLRTGLAILTIFFGMPLTVKTILSRELTLNSLVYRNPCRSRQTDSSPTPS